MDNAEEDKHDRRIRILEDKLKKCEKGVSSKETCWPFHLIFAAVTPIITGIILFFFKPSFVVKPSPNPKVQERDWWKMGLWTFGISVVGWALLYSHYYYFGSGAVVCSR